MYFNNNLAYILCKLFVFQWPGKKATKPSGWAIPCKVNIYFWLGILQDKKHYVDTLPSGYELGSELKNVEKPRSNAPQSIYYLEKHVSNLPKW